MKNLVLTVAIAKSDESHSKLTKFSIEKSREYALKYNADFVCIETNQKFPRYSPTWQRFVLFTDEFKQYDNIMYLDCDLVLTKYAPDLFNIMNRYEQDVFASIDYEHIPARKYTGYFNAGLLGFKRSWLDLWNENSINEMMSKWNNKSHQDQCCLNEMVKSTRDSYINLGRIWNTMTSSFEHMNIVYGIHYIHYHKRKFNDEAIYKYEIPSRSEIVKYNPHEFPTWWKTYNFTHILTMENDYKEIA